MLNVSSFQFLKFNTLTEESKVLSLVMQCTIWKTGFDDYKNYFKTIVNNQDTALADTGWLAQVSINTALWSLTLNGQ